MLKIPTILLIEGGPRATKFYKNLLLNRIDWNFKRGKNPDGANADAGQSSDKNKGLCDLIWEGSMNDNLFSKFQLKNINAELEGREYFKSKGIEQFWTMGINTIANLNDN